MPDKPAYADWHKLTIEIETDDNRRMHDLVRFVLGLQGVLSPSVSVRFSTYWSESLELRSRPHDETQA